MTEEEMKAEITRLAQSVSALEAKNSELIDREKKAKNEAARTSGDIAALEQSLKEEHTKEVANLRKEIEKANSARDAAIKSRQQDQLSSAIATAAAKANVLPEAIEALRYMAEAKHSFVDGAPLIEGKAVDDWFNDFVGSDAGSWARRATDSVGTGANGNSNGKVAPASSSITKENFTLTAFSQYARDYGDEAANRLADKIGMPQLKV